MNGRVHIIPKPRTPAEISRYPVATPTISEALRLVRSESIPTEASQQVQSCIEDRIGRYAHLTLTHRTHCCLPSLATFVLSANPQLVSAACHALFNRSPEDMQACRIMHTFSPKAHTMVTAGISLPRLLYAKLCYTEFAPPQKAGFNLPPPMSSKFTECSLGMKITCGLEILYSKVGGTTCADNLKVPQQHPKWPPFLQKLRTFGYFENELEGSCKYQEKLAAAEEYFMDQRQREGGGAGEGEEEIDPLRSAGLKIAQLLKEDTFSEEEVKQSLENLEPADDTQWLSLTETELDTMLHNSAPPPIQLSSHPRSSEPLPHADSASSQRPVAGEESTADLQSIAYGMESFVEKVSSHTGAEFPWSGNDPSMETPVTFDPDSCLAAIASMLKVEPVAQKCQLSSEDSDGGASSSDDSDDWSEEGEGLEEMKALMEQMDADLAETDVAKSFERMSTDTAENDLQYQATDPLQPVDVNFNLVKNLLDSYSSQEGGAGPGSNILHSLGIKIPQEDNKTL